MLDRLRCFLGFHDAGGGTRQLGHLRFRLCRRPHCSRYSRPLLPTRLLAPRGPDATAGLRDEVGS